MKILINKLALAIYIFSFIYGFGQKIDTQSKSILDQVSTHYQSKKNNYFKFVYRTANKAKTGIFYSSGNKYRLKIMDTEQIFDGHKVYNISSEDQEITIAKPNSDTALFSPLNYINSYKSGYNVQYIGKKNIQGVSTDLVKMTPLRNNGIKYINLYIHSAKKQLVKLEQMSKNNELDIIEILKQVENQNLSPSLFSFKQADYKNYLITEL
ncbi:outer membrane lipoprotein carrier protein LolA [Elizabethkingia argentiflava]|uniref:Outer membrane lipoprotein carrier protein LolA n=1 Tax=Elizabethkingia argenteiflava TaxID=2681556 RepID=A0A845PR47_9FLAO|nr:outer membrane lipoprotein carrier protein LolA [Elizabethkingia argenteiflava]NAW50759.1 outer membrane lipoprotein carrier protein LolA [Elizabethkingia argenteiflava]